MVCPALNVCRVGDGPIIGGHYSLYAGLVRVLFKRVMWMGGDGGEVPVGGEAIRDKDTE
jgi:hypothetical protein